MRLVAIVVNAVLLVALILQLAKYGFPLPGESEFWLVVLAIVAPLMSIAALLPTRRLSRESSWLGMYLVRKKHEERRRIAQLQSEIDAMTRNHNGEA